MPLQLAWFITFNFVNIAWVFFRAKEWGDALKVLGSMFSLDNIVLPTKLEHKLLFLREYGVEFNSWAVDIAGEDWTAIWIIGAFILTLLFKNSNKSSNGFKATNLNATFAGSMMFCIYLFMNTESEFLYFNF